MSERLTRRELKKDEFLEAVLTAVAWAKEHILIAVSIGLALILAVTLAVRVGGSAASRGSGDPKSERALASARAAFGTGGLPAGIAALEDVRLKHGRTPAGREATYLLGNALLESGDFEKAKATYQEYLRRPLFDDLLVDGANLGIAAAEEELGHHAEAAQAYAAVWATGRTPAARIQGALAAARNEEAQGATNRAIELFEGVIQAFPEAPEAAEARFGLDRLRAGAPGQPAAQG